MGFVLSKCATKLIALVTNSNTWTVDSAFYYVCNSDKLQRRICTETKIVCHGMGVFLPLQPWAKPCKPPCFHLIFWVSQIACFFSISQYFVHVFCPCILQHSLYLIPQLRPTAMTGGEKLQTSPTTHAKKCGFPLCKPWIAATKKPKAKLILRQKISEYRPLRGWGHRQGISLSWDWWRYLIESMGRTVNFTYQLTMKNQPNAGRYTIPMDPMGMGSYWLKHIWTNFMIIPSLTG